jgi:DNA-binding response OmpR family regulator
MTGLPTAATTPTQRLDPTVAVPRAARRQALLYAPPPATPAPYITLLESEGLDVLVANSPDSATVLLGNSSPVLIIALVPLLGQELRDLFRKLAPNAEVRAFPGLMPVLEDAVVRPRDAFEFAIRSIVATAGVLSATRKTPRERTVRILQLTEKAAAALRFTGADAAAARVIAALYDVPHALSAETMSKTQGDPGTMRKERSTHHALLEEFIAALGAPFPIILTPPPGDPSQRTPTPLEVVEAAGAFAMMAEARLPQADVALRKLAVNGDIHPIAAEAIIHGSTRGATANRGRVLVVDSDAGARNLLALRLANEGYSTDVAADGRAAMESIRREPPSLIISETVLAGMDGFSLLDTLRHEGRTIPFVFLSARNDALSMNKGLLLGAADFLPKPINTEVLLTKLQKLLGQGVAAADASARLTLSDVTRGSSEPQRPSLTYDQLATGVTIDERFKLVADLGEGGMGRVFKARDERLEEDVVIKVMKEALTHDPKTLEHFKREIRLARKISHPAVVRIFDFFEVGTLKFVTMEYLQGTDLAHEIGRRGAFPIPVALRIGAEFFEGLAAAHDLNVVHRDIKPHNVYLLAGGRVKILDFGIAQGLDPARPDHTVTQSIIGTPDYMSPEQLLGQKLDRRTDIYSAGIMLYEMLTGVLPFEGKDGSERIMARLNRDPDPPSRRAPRIPKQIDQFLLLLLARQRDDRCADARSAATELRDLIQTL